MSKLAVIILTKNEENDIEATIQNAWRCADEVLVVDSGSTDRTLELAEKSGARVVFRVWDNDFAAQRNFALMQTDADWVLYLDADEHLNDELVSAVKKIVTAGVLGYASKYDSDSSSNQQGTVQSESNSPVAVNADRTVMKQYSLQRKSVAFGKKFSYGPLHPDWVPRLFPRKSVTWVGKVHEHPECQLPLEKLPGHIEHYTYRNWQEWEEKMSRYSTIWAEEAYKNGRRTSLPAALLHGIASLFSTLILRLGFLDGWMGICLSCMYFSYTMLKYLKLYGMQKGIHG
jgi:glycosyltransferase involved in cell wall biosynthesis